MGRNVKEEGRSSESSVGKDVNSDDGEVCTSTPLQQKFQRTIRPMLDKVDKLRDLGVMAEGIALPTIVVVGDQSHGKTSVLESLAGISLPRGLEMATRVPLILRLQASSDEEAITIEYEGEKKDVKEHEIEAAVITAQNKLAGQNQAISDKPISLHIRKADAPDLTMVDLPGITRVPVNGQPENIYDQISDIIRQYINLPESVILNVLSANVDFPTCECIRMSQQADRTGSRTLAVVTKVDKSPEGLLEKVTNDSVKIGLGYICVRNRIDDSETHLEARIAEKKLFATHSLLSKLDKRIVGIPALADRLTQIQAESVRRCLPKIMTEIERQLNLKRQELASLPPGVEDKAQALLVFSKTTALRTEAVKKLVVRGDFENYPENSDMHYPARLDEMFTGFADELAKSGFDLMGKPKTKEIMDMMSECRGVSLPNFLPSQVFNSLVRKQLDKISAKCELLVDETHRFAEAVHMEVVKHSCEGYPALLSANQMAARNIIGQSREHCAQFVERMLSKEQQIVFTKNGLYMDIVQGVQAELEATKAAKKNPSPKVLVFPADLDHEGKVARFEREVGKVDLSEVTFGIVTPEYQTAWDMKLSLAAYWAVVKKRIADNLPHEIKFSLQQAMVEGIHDNLLTQTSSAGFDFESIMEEDSVLAQRRRKLHHSIGVLRRALGTVFDSMDKSSSSQGS